MVIIFTSVQNVRWGSRAVVRFSKMSLIMHCDFETGTQNQHFKNTLLVGREVPQKKSTVLYSVYALDNVDNSGRPLMHEDLSETTE